MVPLGMRKRDRIADVHGVKTPLTLRPLDTLGDDVQVFQLVGTAYVHGFMDGEARDWVQQDKLPDRTFQVI
jgi:hypothetical protein